MPRPPRQIYASECYHILNRANRKAQVFHEAPDYAAFLNLIAKAQLRIEIPIFAVCLMPNHLHLVLRPGSGGDVTRWMQWLFATHARHYHEKHGTTGHVWQGRYRQRPFGNEDWVKEKARDAGLEQSLVGVGRPRRSRSGTVCWQMGL